MALWIEKLIPINKFSRPGTKLTKVEKIVEHYTANPGASAFNHYKYFSNLKDRFASAHIFIDKTDVYLIIPLDEVAYHANDGSYRGVPELKPNANYKSIGVELCIEKNGSFHPETIRKAEEVNAELCRRFNLDPLKDIVRHYDVTKKNCPARWVKYSQEFTDFKNRVNALMKFEEVAEVEDDDVVKLQEWQWNMLGDVYLKAHKEGILDKIDWSKKAYQKQLTQSEISFLNAAIVMNKGK